MFLCFEKQSLLFQASRKVELKTSFYKCNGTLICRACGVGEEMCVEWALSTISLLKMDF